MGHPTLVGTWDAPDVQAVVSNRIVLVGLNSVVHLALGTVTVLAVLNLQGGYPF
eukprot:SAG31_NODE_988_length_10542_cov_52.848319_11_plen_54_part_00